LRGPRARDWFSDCPQIATANSVGVIVDSHGMSCCERRRRQATGHWPVAGRSG